MPTSSFPNTKACLPFFQSTSPKSTAPGDKSVAATMRPSDFNRATNACASLCASSDSHFCAPMADVTWCVAASMAVATAEADLRALVQPLQLSPRRWPLAVCSRIDLLLVSAGGT